MSMTKGNRPRCDVCKGIGRAFGIDEGYSELHGKKTWMLFCQCNNCDRIFKEIID